jgi:uncharacterized protein YdhG (YjbR/CyaY superfamily)
MTLAKPSFKSVDEYIAAQPAGVQDVLRRVRGAIRKALPDAEEMISYNMPTYKLRDEAIFSFSAWKRHYSLYAATSAVEAAFQDELAPYEVIKGTIRFPLSQAVPAGLIERIAKFRAKQVGPAAKPAKSSNPSKTRAAKTKKP